MCLNSERVYFWQQTAETISVCVGMPQGISREKLDFRLAPSSISVGVLGPPPLVILEGQLYQPVDPEASTWMLKDDKRSVCLNQTHFRTFPEQKSSLI